MRRVKKPSGSRPRAEHHPGRWRYRIVMGLSLLACAAAATGTAWAWRTGLGAQVNAAVDRLAWETTRTLGLTVDEVLVSGRRDTAPADILAALGVTRGTPILNFDPATARARLLRLGWVKEARVERRLPDTVYVELVERVPIAIWQNDGAFALIDAAGEVIGTKRLENYRALPLLVGADAPLHAAALLGMLAAEPDLMSQVRAAVRVGQRRWNVQLANGIDIRLPETDAALAWHRLASLDREHELLKRDILAVDLRTDDRMVVRLRNGGIREDET